MAYGLGDVVQQQRMIDMSEGGEVFKRVLRTKLDALLGLCESAGCRRASWSCSASSPSSRYSAA